MERLYSLCRFWERCCSFGFSYWAELSFLVLRRRNSPDRELLNYFSILPIQCRPTCHLIGVEQQSQSQNHEEFTRLLVSNQRRIYGFIFTLIQDHGSADDVLQETTALLWKKFDSFELGTDFGAWAMRVARFKVLEWRRKQQRIPLPIEEELLLELAAKAEEAQGHDGIGRREALEHCLLKLSERDTSLLHERYTLEKPVSTNRAGA